MSIFRPLLLSRSILRFISILSDVDIAIYLLPYYDQYVSWTSVGYLKTTCWRGNPLRWTKKVKYETSLTVFETAFYGNPKKRRMKWLWTFSDPIIFDRRTVHALKTSNKPQARGLSSTPKVTVILCYSNRWPRFAVFNVDHSGEMVLVRCQNKAIKVSRFVRTQLDIAPT